VNRSRKGSQTGCHAFGTAAVNSVVALLLILVFGGTKSIAAVAASAPVLPTMPTSPLPEPTATSRLAPTSTPGSTVSTGAGGLGGVPSSIISSVAIALIALIALIAVVSIAAFILGKRRKPIVPPAKPTALSNLPKGITPTERDEPSPASLFTPDQPKPGIPYLESQGRPASVLYYPIVTASTSVGRASDNNLVIDGSFAGWQTVSRHHAAIEYDGSRVTVVGHKTPNGIQVNSQRTGANVLRDGWTVSFGQVKFLFRGNQRGGA
jgi:hypothetical protein